MAEILTPKLCVDGLVALLGTVAGVGRVHDYRRIVRTENDVRSLLTDPDDATHRVNAWYVSPAENQPAKSERHPGHHGIGVKGGGNVLTTFRLQVEGLFGILDVEASEKTFRDLLWAVADECNAYGKLNITGLVYQGPANVTRFGYILFAGAPLCHYGVIEIELQGRTRPNP